MGRIKIKKKQEQKQIGMDRRLRSGKMGTGMRENRNERNGSMRYESMWYDSMWDESIGYKS